MDIQVSRELKYEIYRGSHIRVTHLVPNLEHITVTNFNMYFSVQVLNLTCESGSFQCKPMTKWNTLMLDPTLYEECFEIAEKVIERHLCHMTTYAFDFKTVHFSSSKTLKLLKIFEILEFCTISKSYAYVINDDSSCGTDLLRKRVIARNQP